MKMKKIPIVIDVDTGTDDAIAVICSLLSQDALDIRAFTAVAGNVTVDLTSKNTLSIVDYLGWDIKVSKGAEKPLCRPLHKAISHGETGLGDVEVQEAKRGFYHKPAWETIYEEAEKANGELQILAVGPLTNIALTLQKHPDLKEKIKYITIMGGALVGGNMTMTSEFNTYVDPEAAKIVFEAGIPMTMVGLDVTLKTELPDWVVEKAAKAQNPYAQLATRIFRFMKKRSKLYGYDAPNVHDVLALSSILVPGVIKTRPYYMTVETKGEITRGMTIADFNNVEKKQPNVNAACEVDVKLFWDWISNLLQKKA